MQLVDLSHVIDDRCLFDQFNGNESRSMHLFESTGRGFQYADRIQIGQCSTIAMAGAGRNLRGIGLRDLPGNLSDISLQPRIPGLHDYRTQLP